MANPTRISENRIRRAVIHPCQHCGHNPVVVTRTPDVVCVRCAMCGETWSVPKPGVPPLGGTLA
jgi:transcription elongation factor Elf1